MAAYLVCPSEKDWATIERFLRSCAQGAIVLSPAFVASFKKKHGVDLTDRESDRYLKDYDFGGEADLWIDWLNNPASEDWATNALKEHLGVKCDNREDRPAASS
jgi:hypothetical protein